MADLWSHSNGVSQSQFLSVVRELKRTQNALKEALKKPGKGDQPIETTSTLLLESRVKAQQIEICELKQRIENLQVHKKQLKNNIEGISVAPSSSSFEISRTSRENSFSKEEAEFSRREKQLQDEINNWKQKVEHLRKENNVQQLNYRLKEETERLQKMEENYKQAIQDKNVYEQRIAEMKACQVQETNPIYRSPKTVAHGSYEKPVSGRTHRTVEDLHEALNEFRRQPSNNPRTYRCDRCYEEFTSEEDHLQHIQKCYD
uniref:Uncharacterized protein n=1 Tax=Magallana gigas TaxID=29159 RepID=K1P980_MAGGI